MDLNPEALYKDLQNDLRSFLPKHLRALSGKKTYPVGLSIRERAALSLSNSLLSKYTDSVSPSAESKALEKFLLCNNRCKDWKLLMETPGDELLLNEFKSSIWQFFNAGGYQLELNPVALARGGRTGPGASVGSMGSDFYTKMFAGPLTCTRRSLYSIYRLCGLPTERWSDAERLRSLSFGEATVVEGSRLCFVPKTTEISRVICTEPVLNMWYQLSAYDALHDQLKRCFGINLREQPERNRELSRIGSLTGAFGTIDLESASDSISSELLRWCLPSEVFRDLSLYRCPTTELEKERYTLHMFSSMGNGYTFPLQTIIFCCVVAAVYRLSEIPIIKPKGPDNGNFGVFGDDIICESFAYARVCRLLHLLGFVVNPSKSFNEGSFRESCGNDFYHGRNVRGVYLKEATLPAIFSTINLLIQFSARTGVHVPRTVRYLRNLVPWTPIPLWENVDAGLHTHPSFFTPRLNRNGSYAYKAWIPLPAYLRVEESGDMVSCKHEKKRLSNPQGMYISFLGGRITDMRISVRQRRVRYVRKLRVAPNWVYPSGICEMAPVHTGEQWKRWESAFYLSL